MNNISLAGLTPYTVLNQPKGFGSSSINITNHLVITGKLKGPAMRRFQSFLRTCYLPLCARHSFSHPSFTALHQHMVRVSGHNHNMDQKAIVFTWSRARAVNSSAAQVSQGQMQIDLR
jgi:hypothetical protein